MIPEGPPNRTFASGPMKPQCPPNRVIRGELGKSWKRFLIWFRNIGRRHVAAKDERTAEECRPLTWEKGSTNIEDDISESIEFLRAEGKRPPKVWFPVPSYWKQFLDVYGSPVEEWDSKPETLKEFQDRLAEIHRRAAYIAFVNENKEIKRLHLRLDALTRKYLRSQDRLRKARAQRNRLQQRLDALTRETE